MPPLDLNSPTLRCDILHPETTSCTYHFLTFLQQGIIRALPVYLPVYVLPLVLFRMKDILSNPIKALTLTSFSLFRSCLFLSSYCAVCWYAACTMTNQLGSKSNINGFVAGFAGGLCVAIEKSGRRIELGLYVLAQAIPAAYRYLHERGYVGYYKKCKCLCFCCFNVCDYVSLCN